MLNKSSKNSRQKIVFIGKSLFVVSEKRKTICYTFNRTGLLKNCAIICLLDMNMYRS